METGNTNSITVNNNHPLAGHFLSGGGEMGQLIRSYDWSTTSLGPVESWPHSLKTSVGIMLRSPYPMFVWWGKEMIMFHNDAYFPVLGKRHPEALGKSGPVIWADVWDFIGPLMYDVLERGKSCYFERQLLIPERKGYKEETYFTFSYSPIPDDHSGVGGIFCVCSEDTNQVLSQRRLNTLQNLSELASAESIKEVFEKSCEILARNPNDTPFGLFYQVSNNGKPAKLEGAFGIPYDTEASPLTLSPENIEGQAWPLFDVAATRNSSLVLDDLHLRFSSLPSGPWEESAKQAIIVPLKKSGQDELAGFFISGISPRLEFNEDYKSFLTLVAGQVSTAIANVSVLEEERKRMQKIVELDKAKTHFFNSVSHEFRTPLTLMLGPLEEVTAETNKSLSLTDRQQLITVHQNALRLLKLVNTLLDFSRIEAKRVQASFEPADLSSFTSELASSFQSVIEKAGLKYEVSCSRLSESVYVDPEMWEKIVLNLISNSFKFTFEGKITVELRETEAAAKLIVQDTGVGIPQEEIPNLFKRFHRIENSRSRTHEGTGIGLALVKELVELHGGIIDVTSAVGKGTTFTVSIPKGTSHLDEERISTGKQTGSAVVRTQAFVNEAMLWGKSDAETKSVMEEDLLKSEQSLQTDKNVRLLVVDDNADMLKYLKRILSACWKVEAVKDGKEALAVARREIPDLILTDVMMPNMNGFELLYAIRQNSRTKHVPVILLSARAGDEATVEGLEKGANDYLVKPFSASELIARVKTQLEITNAHQDNAQLRETQEELKKFKFISDHAFDAFILMREDGTFAYLNDLALNRWGYTKEEAKSIRVPDVDPIYQEEKFNEAFALAQKQNIPPFETLHKRKNGSIFPVEVSMGGLTLEGNPHMFAVARDITERKKIENEIKESEERFRTLAETLPQLVWMTNEKGAYEYASGQWKEYSGLDPRQESTWQEMVHPDDMQATMNTWLKSLATGETYHVEVRLKNKQGEYRWYFGQGEPIRNEEGKIIKWIGAFTDIHDQKTLTEKLEKLVAARTKELQRSNKDLQEFAHVVSHDLKEPARKIKTFGNLIVNEFEEVLPEKGRLYLEKIENAANRLNGLIEGVLQYSSMDAVEQMNEPVDLNELLRNIELDLEVVVQQKGASIVYESLPVVEGSAVLLHQLFYNLINNSLKFSKPGTPPFIQITFERIKSMEVPEEGLHPDREYVKFKLKDNGIGFKQSDAQNIFKTFSRLNPKHKYEGTGLGLALCKKIVERHGGIIKAEGKENEGATFHLILPSYKR
jgi:PAS domain S-box-containing protein